MVIRCTVFFAFLIGCTTLVSSGFAMEKAEADERTNPLMMEKAEADERTNPLKMEKAEEDERPNPLRRAPSLRTPGAVMLKPGQRLPVQEGGVLTLQGAQVLLVKRDGTRQVFPAGSQIVRQPNGFYAIWGTDGAAIWGTDGAARGPMNWSMQQQSSEPPPPPLPQ